MSRRELPDAHIGASISEFERRLDSIIFEDHSTLTWGTAAPSTFTVDSSYIPGPVSYTFDGSHLRSVERDGLHGPIRNTRFEYIIRPVLCEEERLSEIPDRVMKSIRSNWSMRKIIPDGVDATAVKHDIKLKFDSLDERYIIGRYSLYNILSDSLFAPRVIVILMFVPKNTLGTHWTLMYALEDMQLDMLETVRRATCLIEAHESPYMEDADDVMNQAGFRIGNIIGEYTVEL